MLHNINDKIGGSKQQMYKVKSNLLFIKWIIILLTVFLITPSVMGLALSDYELAVYTDKPQYYPGEEVTIFGRLTENGEGVPDAGICISVIDPDEIEVFGACWVTNDTGEYLFFFTLEIEAMLGIYDVHVHADEYQVEANTTFEVILENDPPEAPTIDGETHGNAGEEYEYTFVTTDPDEDNVSYWIVWGDGCPAVEWIGPYPSGEVITLSHTFEEQGTFTISAKAKDIHEAESEWGYLDVEMPVNIPIFGNILFRILERLMERFPIIEQIFSIF